jgi:hypothetical protein
MAQKKANSDKRYPVVRSAQIDVTGPITSTTAILKIGDLMSKVNRRLYRQARNYEVKIDLDVDAPGVYEVFAISDTWMNQNALKMAHDIYLDNTDDERERIKNAAMARWNDFRVLPGVTGQEYNPALFDASLALTQLTVGEFQNTRVQDQTGTLRNFTWSPTPTASQYSIVGQYDLAGDTGSNPSAVTGDMPYADLEADDSAQLGADLQTFGNLPPYDGVTSNQATPFVKVATLGTNAAGSQKLSTGFFTAPCGFVFITNVNLSDAPFITWTVKSGDYKGVHAPSMIDGMKMRSASGTMGTWRGNVWTKD